MSDKIEVDTNFIDEATVQQVALTIMSIATDNDLSENMKTVALQATVSVLDQLRRSVEGHYDTLQEVH